MKYQTLPKEDLEKLEKEFIDFLVVNGITADDWISIKEQKPEEAEQVIDQFSDVIWHGILQKAKYLEHQTSKGLFLFEALSDQINLIFIEQIEGHTQTKRLSKPYAANREMELFEMIKKGCVVTEGEMWNEMID